MRPRRINCVAAVVAVAGVSVPATAVAAVQPDWRLSTAGLGPVEIGMTVSQASAAIGSPIAARQLDGSEPAPGACFTASAPPRRYGISLLGTGHRVAVIAVFRRGLATTKGVRVGDSVDRLRRRHRGLVAKRQFYTPTWFQYEFRRGNRKLIFSTDNRKVTAITAGRRPEVGYVEGCA